MNEQITKSATDKNDGRKVSPTRLKVLQVAANLFADRGYSGVGVNEISEATGLSEADVVFTLADEIVPAIVAQFGTAGAQVVAGLLGSRHAS